MQTNHRKSLSLGAKGLTAGYLASPIVETYLHSYLSHRYFEMNEELAKAFHTYFTLLGTSPTLLAAWHRYHHGPMGREPAKNLLETVLHAYEDQSKPHNKVASMVADSENSQHLCFPGLSTQNDPILKTASNGGLELKFPNRLSRFFSKSNPRTQIPFLFLVGSTASIRYLTTNTTKRPKSFKDDLKSSVIFFASYKLGFFGPAFVFTICPEAKKGYVRGDQPEGVGEDKFTLSRLILLGRGTAHNTHHRDPGAMNLPPGVFDRDKHFINLFRRLGLIKPNKAPKIPSL